MEKKINKKKIVTYAAAGLLTVTMATGIGLHIYDSNIDHYNEYCPLNQVFGVEHQVHAINNDQDVSTYATRLEDGVIRIYDDAEEKTIYTAPAGYTLGNEGFAYRYLEDGTIDKVPAIKKTFFAAPEDFVLQGNKIYKDIENVEKVITEETNQPKTAVVVIPDEVIADSTMETIPEKIDSSIYEYAIANDVRLVLSLEDNNYYVWHPTQYYTLRQTLQEEGTSKYTAIGADRVVIDAQSGIVYAAKTSELELFDLQLLNNQSR